MKKYTSKALLMTLVFVALAAAAAFAVGGPGGGRGFGPPQAMLDACNGKQVGDQVEFQNRRGRTITGTCQQVNDQMMAIPDKRGGRSMGFSPRMAERLGLTDAQQAQVKAIVDAQQTQRLALRTQMMEKRAAVRKAMSTSPLDEAALRQVLEEQNALRTDALIQRTQVREQLYNLLTPEQQKSLALSYFDRGGKGRDGQWGKRGPGNRSGGGRGMSW